MERYDVAIVGGGPAGMTAGHAAATAGAETVVLEKGVPREDREGLGPDSTDAAGLLDYWVDLMDIDFDQVPEEVILRTLDRAEFIGPSETLEVDKTGIDSTYPNFGCTFDRTGMDDWLRERAEDAGASYRTGVSVTDIEHDFSDGHEHTIHVRDGEQLAAEYLILADGPQRQVTNRVLDRFVPGEQSITEYVGTTDANHIAYQEYREFPEDAFEPHSLKFWWGAMPGETAYPWVFPNDGTVARVGLTMPIGLDIDEFDRSEYLLLDEDDEGIPSGSEYIERLFERAYPEYDLEDFPLVEDRGKQGGTETYAISSTQPIDSPTQAGIAVAGGAMGTTSAFHEGGYHVAVRSGSIAGELAATDRLDEYNEAWKSAIGTEVGRNVAFADIVETYGPDDWDHAFRTARNLLANNGAGDLVKYNLGSGLSGLKLYGQYVFRKFKQRDGGYVQLQASEYRLPA
jgi:electron-transferring-flavoprotein dehydrogenase